MRDKLLKRAGFTFIEALVTMVIMSLVVGVISTVYFSSIHVWKRCSSQSQADPPAHMTINQLSKELKNAYLVNEMGDTSITFTTPLQDANGINILPLQPGRVISYYISDESGVANQEGTILWRSQTDIASGATKQRRIADNVEALDFSYDATPTRVLKIYALSVTVVGKEGRHEHRTEFGSHVAFRN